LAPTTEHTVFRQGVKGVQDLPIAFRDSHQQVGAIFGDDFLACTVHAHAERVLQWTAAPSGTGVPAAIDHAGIVRRQTFDVDDFHFTPHELPNVTTPYIYP